MHLYLPLFDVNETNVFECYHVTDYDVMMQGIVVDPVRDGLTDWPDRHADRHVDRQSFLAQPWAGPP